MEIGYYHTISADWFAVNNASGTQYTYMATGYDFTDELSSFLSYGMTKVSGENNDTNDYSDLKIGIGFSIFDLNVELAHTSTEYDTKSSKPDKIADDRFILSFSKSF